MLIQLNKLNLYNIIVSVSLLVHIGSESGYAQKNKPITKENIVAALKDCKNRRFCTKCRRCVLKASDFIQEIKKHKVNFLLLEPEEREVREAGGFLSDKELNDLIDVIRDSFLFFPDPNKGTWEEIKKMNLEFFDSSGDKTIDEKIRLIHTSISTTLQLQTNYRFYSNPRNPHDVNLFSIILVDKKYPDGHLFIGIEFLKRYLQKDRDSFLENDSILYLAIAHEMSHFKQMKVGWYDFNSDRQRHLHADFLAGWWVARFLKTTDKNSPEYKNAFIRVITLAYNIGQPNEDFFPSTHGSPKERLDAVSAGFGLENEINLDTVYRKGIEHVQR